ncbi:MAG: hypothetical protein COA43_12920 [Robiginitomaculum sp.]|nr:MAG: hypothetical protein COA43_12920 [Robiginitomaculum sp.]
MVPAANMHDNMQSLRTVYQGLTAQKRPDKRGQVFAFTAARSGCGTSYVTRMLAIIAAREAAKTEGAQVLLVDMDIQNNAQSRYFFAQQNFDQFGQMDGPYDATYGEIPFWRITPSMVDEEGRNLTDNHFMSLYRLSQIPLSFSYFQWDQFREGQAAHLQNARAYWHKLREHYTAIFVDTPAQDRSDMLSVICEDTDATILVSAPEHSRSQDLSNIANKVASLGAKCTGVILNQVVSQPSYYEKNT